MCGSQSSAPDEVADEEGGADGDEDDGQVDLSARVGRLGTGASHAGRSNATGRKEGRKDEGQSFTLVFPDIPQPEADGITDPFTLGE